MLLFSVMKLTAKASLNLYDAMWYQLYLPTHANLLQHFLERILPNPQMVDTTKEGGVTVVLRVVRSFPHRNIRPLVLKEVPLSLTVQQVKIYMMYRAIFPHELDALVMLCISKIPTSAPRPFKRGSCLWCVFSSAVQVFHPSFQSVLTKCCSFQEVHLWQPEDWTPGGRSQNLGPSDQQRARRNSCAHQTSW